MLPRSLPSNEAAREAWSDLCSVNVNPACPRLIQMFYSVISHKDASRNQRYSSISHSHKHESSSSSPPRGLAPPPPSWQRAAFWQSMLILLTHPHPSHWSVSPWTSCMQAATQHCFSTQSGAQMAYTDPRERTWCSRSLVVGAGEIRGGYWAERGHWQRVARRTKW